MEKNFSDLSAFFSEQLKRSAVMISSPGKHETGSIFKYYVSLFVVGTKPTIPYVINLLKLVYFAAKL
jgi:hypothetical protein